MRKLVALLTLVSASAFAAELEMKDDVGNAATLTDKPCVSTKGALANIPGAARVNMKSASILWKGDLYDACWHDLKDGTVFIFDEAGDAGRVPFDRFQPKHGT